MIPLEKAIVATVAYYDTLDYPLTSWEVWKYLVNPVADILSSGNSNASVPGTPVSASLRNVRRVLRGKRLRNCVTEQNGLYMLTGREYLSGKRIERQTWAISRWRRARRVAWFLQGVPFLRMVAGSGSLALWNTDEQSDLDFFIVARAGRIWTVRLLAAAATQLLGVRRHGKHVVNRVCLNHFVADDALEIPHQTMYTAHLYARLVPLIESKKSRPTDDPPRCFDRGRPKVGKRPTASMLERFWDANTWMQRYLVFPPLESGKHQLRAGESWLLRWWALFWERVLGGRVGDWMERKAKKFQLQWMRLSPRHPASHNGMCDAGCHSGRVVVSDSELAFHPDSPEVEILKRFQERLDCLPWRP